MRVSEYFGDFDRRVILPAMQWWDEYIETGVSPEYDEERDRDVLAALRRITEEDPLSGPVPPGISESAPPPHH